MTARSIVGYVGHLLLMLSIRWKDAIHALSFITMKASYMLSICFSFVGHSSYMSGAR